jgi:hypothetical protein
MVRAAPGVSGARGVSATAAVSTTAAVPATAASASVRLGKSRGAEEAERQDSRCDNVP